MKQKQHSTEAIIRILRQSEGDETVEQALETVLTQADPFTGDTIEAQLGTTAPPKSVQDITVAPVDLTVYDGLLEGVL
jgi:hypothetical protein